MKPILKNYRSLIGSYRKIESDTGENEIHDKRVILRRIFPILVGYGIKPTTVKNGEKAFNLFGRLRDVQVQVLKLESLSTTLDFDEYLDYLKGRELKLKKQVRKFSKSKQLEFPAIKNKAYPDKTSILCHAEKSLNKLIQLIPDEKIDHAGVIHKIRIGFKKFRYNVEMLSYLGLIDEEKLENLKQFQDKLGEIQDYTVLISGIHSFYLIHSPGRTGITDSLEMVQKVLMEEFNTGIGRFVAVCRDVLEIKNKG